MSKLYLSSTETCEASGLSRTSIWRLESRGEFPQRRQLSPQRVGWLRSEVEAWAKHRPLALANPEMADRARREAQGQ